MPANAPLTAVTAGMPIVFGGDRVTSAPADIAARFAPGDRLLVVQETGDVLLVPAEQQRVAAAAVGRAHAAFAAMAAVSDAQITRFYDEFAGRLEREETWAAI